MAMTSAQFGYASLAAQGAASLINAFGAFGVSKYQNAAARAQANIARINAEMMELNYQSTLRSAERAIVSHTMKAGRVKSKQRAALAANGIAIGEGSAAELQASTDLIKEMDVDQIKKNALSEAWGYRQKAAGYEGQALMAEAMKRNPFEAFGTTLLTGASQVAGSYMLMRAVGVFDQKQATSQPKPEIPSIDYGRTPYAGNQWGVSSQGFLMDSATNAALLTWMK